MLKADLKAILKNYNIDIDALVKAAIDEKEVDFPLEIKAPVPAGFSLLSDDELENVKKAVKTGAEQSIPEIIAKAMMEEFKIKIDVKNPTEVAKAYAKLKAEEAVNESGKTIDDQIKERDKTIEGLRTSVTTTEAEKLKALEEAQGWKSKYDDTIEMEEWTSRFLPETANPLLRPKDYRQRIAEEEGVFYKKIDGQWKTVDSAGVVIKDQKLLKEIDPKAKTTEIFTKRTEWNKPVASGAPGGAGSGGHGTGNSGGNGNGGLSGDKPKNMTEFKAYARSNGWNQIRQQGEYSKMISENKDFDPNS